MVIDWISMPPKVGIAIGTIISAPFPVESMDDCMAAIDRL